MTLRAEVRIGTPELLLGPTVETLPDLYIESESQSTTEVVFFSARSAAADPKETFAEFERILTEADSVGELRCVDSGGAERVYAVEVGLDRPLLEDVAGDLGINVVGSYSRSGDVDWTLELDVPDRGALRDFRTFCVENGIKFELQRLYYPESGSEDRDFGLSELQRETLQVALESGYFDVPRQVSQRELAERLDASPTAVSQRLRRAVAALIRNSIGSE